MTEDDIVHENGNYWVCKTKKNWFGYSENTYSVYKNGLTYAEPVVSFEQNEDGKSLAIKYCDYRAEKASRRGKLQEVANWIGEDHEL